MNLRERLVRAQRGWLPMAALIIGVLIVGTLVIGWSALCADRAMRAELLQQARLVAQAVNLDRVRALTGTEADLAAPDYRRLKEQLAFVKKVGEKYRFIYLMGRKPDGRIFFFLDNEPPGSKDFSPPGQIFSEAPEGYSRVFNTGIAAVEGPVRDRWGTWVSALVPLNDPQTGALVAVLGMDIDARAWKWNIAAREVLPVSLMLILLVIIAAGFRVGRIALKLRESLERLQAILESVQAGVLIIDAETHKIVDVNPLAVRMIGADRDKIIGSICHQFVCPAEVGKCPITDLGQTIDSAERILLNAAGTQVPIIKTVVPIVLGGRKHLLESFIDITKRKQAEGALRRSQEQFALAVQGSNDGIWDWDLRDNRLYLSPKWKEQIGYRDEELVNAFATFEDHLHPDDKPQVQDYVRRYLKGEVANYSVEFRLRRKDGTYAWILARGAAIRDAAGVPIRMAGSHTDITDRKQAEVELHEINRQLKAATARAEMANAAKSSFLANMSHEIRSPMNAILGFADILNSQVENPKHKEFLAAITASGKTLLGLINDILDLSKIEAGKLKLEYGAVNPRAIFNDIRQVFKLETQRKGINFQVEIDPELPAALVLDEIRLRQIILNLVGNAVKFTSSGSITLSAAKRYRDPDHSAIEFVFSVKDTGMGIALDQQEKIFEVFHQQVGQSQAQYGGTGLGLAICKRLVEAMGGRITVTSTVGQGSTFQVVLDNVSVSATSDDVKIQAAPVIGPAFEFAPARILLVDDLKLNRILLRNFLGNPAFTLDEAENGQEALEVIRRDRPDLIMMDMRMPVMDGAELIRQLKADASLASIPVIIVSASAMPEEELEARALGCDGYLRKPVQRAELLQEISRFLKRRESATFSPSQAGPAGG